MFRSKSEHPRRQASIVVCFLFLLLSPAIMGSPWKAEAQQRVLLPVIFHNFPIPNANFDLGRDGSWTEFSSKNLTLILNAADPLLQGLPAHSGNWLAWLGGTDAETSILSQIVPVPPTANFLNYFFWVESFDAECGFDTAQVRLGINLLRTHDLCQATNTPGWTLGKINVSGFRGQTLELSFRVDTDDLVDSWSNFFLDTISFSAQ